MPPLTEEFPGSIENSYAAIRDLAAILAQFLRLAAVSIVSGQVEAGLKQPPRDRPAHVADSYKSEFVFF
jgi:hypothetical protein